MLNWLKGWRGIAAGAAFIALSLIYNSVFKVQIANSVLLQIPGYFLIGVGCMLVLYAALAAPETENERAAEAPSEEDDEAVEEEQQ